MACVVVFCTTYALILPAITLENAPMCGLEEHLHTEACYAAVSPAPEFLCSPEGLMDHVHGEECCGEDGALICGYADYLVHTHDEFCYGEEGDLICPLPEIEVHQHDESCCEEVRILTCGQEESGHTHGPACYTLHRGELTCTQEEAGHVHSDDCYAWTEELACGLEEAEGHTHDDSCYTTETVLACEKDEIILHTHDETCYDTEDCPLCAQPEPEEHSHRLICGQVEVLEHQHTKECIRLPEEQEATAALVCGLEEHTHTDACYEPKPEVLPPVDEASCHCGLMAHSHTETCYDAEGTLTCPLEEHIHTQTCTVFTELTFTGPDYTVTVSYGADAGLPEGVALTVREIASGTEEYQTYYDQSAAAFGTEEAPEKLVFARFFDIQFQLDGQILEPAAPVSVTITYDTPVDTSEAANCKSIHFKDDSTELLEVATEAAEDGSTSFTHTQDSFSVVGNVVTVAFDNPADNGPDSLPVDYYVCIDGEWVCVGSTKTGWYNDWNGTEPIWTNTNRDFITVAQANSIFGPYGFTPEGDPAQKIAYQRKETSVDANWYTDTYTYYADRAGANIIPISRNNNPASGYNLRYIEKEYYTVSVYDPGHLAYAAGEALPETQTVLKGGSATVTVKPLANGNAVWKCLNASNWTTVADGTANSDGTVTFHLTDITQPLRITPVASDLGPSRDITVDFAVFLDGQWQKVGSTSPVYSHRFRTTDPDDRDCLTYAQVESVLGPYGFAAHMDDPYVLAHYLSSFGTNQSMYDDGGRAQLSDGTYIHGLSWVNTCSAYTFFYLPNNPDAGDGHGAFYGVLPSSFTSSSPEMRGNRFWSVTVRDDGRNIYDSAQLAGMVQYAPDNGTVSVTVRNANGILWSCRGVNGEPVEVTSTQSGGYTTFVIQNITQPVEVTATKANPSFTVQYYANIPRFAESGSNPLKVIDTSAAGNGGTTTMPTNGGSMATRNIYLEGIDRNTDQNAGVATELYRVKTTTELTRMYTERACEYESSPGLAYFNKLKDNESYTLKEVWVLKAGKNPESTNRADWDIYPCDSDTAFTNEAGQAVGNAILINDGAVIRLVSDTSSGNYYNGTTFYDYDISNGNNAGWRTGITGINKKENYGTSREHNQTWTTGNNVFAFGNANCGTGMSGYQFDGGPLNKWNGTNTKYTGKNTNYGGATFRLVDKLNDDGTILYNKWLVVPKLFNEPGGEDGKVIGKQTYAGSSLTFDRVGDTYTLSSATLKKRSGTSSIDELQYFFHPSPAGNVIWDGVNNKVSTWQNNIFTNNFWPMDYADDKARKDENWGTYGNPGHFEGFGESYPESWTGLSDDFPESDDGKAHNWFFGMNFALSFNLTEDYVGPLEYTFFGDDDLWVFLDGRLVCDIGGVHSSIGEFVNLRDYLPNGSSGQHTLSFFYTERGASGSTCYMSFTLPSVSSATTERETGSLELKKSLAGTGSTDYSKEEYQFRVELLTGENGSPLNHTFSYSCSDGTYGTVKSGGTITLHQNESATISGIPAGTYYRVTELTHEGYHTTVNGNEGYIVSGKIETGAIKPASFVNSPYYALPETGGTGTHWYIWGGLALMLASLLCYTIPRRKEARTPDT
ncbi:MAG: fibro-slime domain-containing protein [Oscillospiraceae bacterium]|nr:fibro-slime domain-containing protein [Oscillospiraceae bacterium]